MEEEIEHLKELKEELSYILDKTNLASETYFKYHRKIMAIEFVLNELERLQKGINSLMQSRKKWKDRYYKLKTENSNISRELLHRTDELNKLLEENKQLKISNAVYVKDNGYLMENSILKSAIRNKIEELENSNGYAMEIDTLKELLGDK